MSKAEEKNMEIIKKAKEFLPDGGYSEKELNLAFSMFINGYHQAEKDFALTWEDIAVIDQLLWDLSTEYSAKNDAVGYFEEVAKRFNETKSNK